MGGNIGLILSPTIAGILFNHYLWLCFVISGVSISVSTVLIAFFIEDTTERIRKESREEVKGQDGNILRVVKNSATLILFLIAMGFYQGAYSQFSYLMPLDISKAYPENGSIIYGTVTSLNCIIVVVLTPVITMAMKKVAMTKKYLLGIILQALSLWSICAFIWSDCGILCLNNTFYAGRDTDDDRNGGISCGQGFSKF